MEDVNEDKIVGTFFEFRIQKLIKRKGYTLYVKWKGYDNSFGKNDTVI